MKTLDDLLSEAAWDKLEGADGAVPEVPQRIRDLGSVDPLVRERALGDLLEALNQQGSLYEPAAYAIAPLLFQLKTAGFPGRKEVLELLFRFSRGTGHLTAHQNLSIVRDMYGTKALAEKVAEEAKWLAYLHEELLKGADGFLDLLNDPDAEIRKPSLALLGRLPERKADALPKMKILAASDPDSEIREAAHGWIKRLESLPDGASPSWRPAAPEGM